MREQQHQNREHEQYSRCYGDGEVREHLVHDFRVAGLDQAHALRKIRQGGQGTDLLHGRAELYAVQIGLQPHAAALVVAADCGGAVTEADIRNLLERHSAAGCGRHGEILQGGQVAAGLFDEAHADRNLPVRERELGAVLVDVAQCSDADRLADARDGDAELRRQVQARLDQDLRPLHVAADERLAQLGHRAHLVHHLVSRGLDQQGVVSRDVQRQVTAATAPLEVDSRIGDRLQLLDNPVFPLSLTHRALIARYQGDEQLAGADVADVIRADGLDDGGDFGLPRNDAIRGG